MLIEVSNTKALNHKCLSCVARKGHTKSKSDYRTMAYQPQMSSCWETLHGKQKKILRTHNDLTMEMHINEGEECVYIPS